MNKPYQAQANLPNAWLSYDVFWRLVIVALLIRVLVMPFFGHVDVLSEAWRVYHWDVNGVYVDNITRNASDKTST